MGKIFCFIGKSSSGKDTIFNEITKIFPNILKIIPYTTRPIRNGEIDGKDYYFVTDEIYKKMLYNNMVIESRSYDTKYGIWIYFTSLSNINLDNNYMIINTLEGYEQIKKYFGDNIVVPIYIEVDNGIRLERALKREKMQMCPKYNELCRRFLADEEDFSETKLINANIDNRFNNDNLFECIEEISNYINSKLEEINYKQVKTVTKL